MPRARRLVAAAVVLALAGTPVAASACALWCPPGAGHAGMDARRVDVVPADARSVISECPAPHPHDPPAGAAGDAGSAAHDARFVARPAADAAPPRAASALAAASACCAVSVADTVHRTAPLDPAVWHAPALQVTHLRRPVAPTHQAHPDPSRPPAAVRATRALVLRI